MTKILLAIDSSPWSTTATEALIAQTRPDDAEVRVLHAVEWPVGGPPYLSFGVGPGSIQGVLDLRDKARDAAASLVERVAAQLRSAGFTASGVVKEGDARSAIVDTATTWKADLIVMGSHGHRGLDRLALGSVAESVMRRASCSVEIVRSRDGRGTAVA